MTLHVLDTGLYSLIVDFGRPTARSLGVPVGGAADRFALALGNGLVGNPANTAALEINLAGPTLQAECALACVVYGAPFALSSDRRPLCAGTSFTLEPEEILRIGSTHKGMRAYLCVGGGLQTPQVLGSRSGLEPLQVGAKLRCQSGSIAHRFIRSEFEWNREPLTLAVLDGPQFGWFSPEEFFSQEFTISPASNRMGIRLQGRPLTMPGRELVSEPVCPGSVQVTRDGQCIILGADGQTIGGYPKIAQVISSDLDKLAQLRPDERVHFKRLGLSEAERLYRQKQTELHEWLSRLNSIQE
jgi:biotin-dependent carboxylase-like uncharacterized protein